MATNRAWMSATRGSESVVEETTVITKKTSLLNAAKSKRLIGVQDSRLRETGGRWRKRLVQPLTVSIVYTTVIAETISIQIAAVLARETTSREFDQIVQ